MMLTFFASNAWTAEEMKEFGEEIKPAMSKYLGEKYPEGGPYAVDMAAIVASGRKSSL